MSDRILPGNLATPFKKFIFLGKSDIRLDTFVHIEGVNECREI